jgi:hypothetical protein
MKFHIVKKINCSDIKPAECSDRLLEKLQSLNLKLKADNDTDTVNGSLTINHVPEAHEIEIEIYEHDEKPNEGLHPYKKVTIKKPKKKPTLKEIENCFE